MNIQPCQINLFHSKLIEFAESSTRNLRSPATLNSIESLIKQQITLINSQDLEPHEKLKRKLDKKSEID